MKPTRFNIPLPRCMDRWNEMVKKYKLAEPYYVNSRVYSVQIPPGWAILKDPEGREHHWIMFDEDFKPVAMIYLTKKLGFTLLYSSDKEKDSGGKHEDGL